VARLRTVYVCTDCGHEHPKWTGQCAGCGAWNSLVEDVVGDAPAAPTKRAAARPASAPVPLTTANASTTQAAPTGIGELDRVLGGGLVPGSVTLLGGEPGIGKSTLLSQVVGRWPGRSLYVSAEESTDQVRLRAGRLGVNSDNALLVSLSVVDDIVAAIDAAAPSLVVIDSIQTIADTSVGSAPGSVVQVRECAHRLVQEAKARGIAVVLVGHVTKEGSIAGPRLLEHVVDTVLSFEGDRVHALRTVRAMKHRFGSTNELGLFEMTADGLRDVPDASTLFLADRQRGVAGSVVVPVLDGHRPLLVELQALTTKMTSGVPPRRSSQGFESSRLAMLLAVLDRRAGCSLSAHEVFVSVVGGIRVSDPGADLGMCVALASSLRDLAIDPTITCIGEVGLAGEVRHVAQIERRLSEAARLGFTSAIIPASASVRAPQGVKLVKVASIGEAITRAM
jgi:DNA repair protein RadA/Sms